MSIKRRRFLIGAAGLAAVSGAGLYAISSKDASIVPGKSRTKPILSDDDMPSSVDVVVIGGGIAGVSAALSLAERGVSVALFEKGEIAGEASGRNHGQLSLKHQLGYNMPLIQLSLDRWKGLNALTGEETGYRDCNAFDYTNSDADVEAIEAWQASVVDHLREPVRVLTGGAVRQSLSGMRSDYKYAFYLPGEAVAEPELAAPAIAEGARKLGAKIFTGCAVRGLERTAGRISGVVTERGAVKTQAVVLAGGVWTPTFLRSLDVSLPIFPGHASLVHIAPIEGGPKDVVNLGASGVSLRPHIDGGYVAGVATGVAPILPSAFPHAFQLLNQLRNQHGTRARLSFSNFWREFTTPAKWPLDRPSPFEDVRIYQPEIQHANLDQVMKDVRAELPLFENAVEKERWSGALTGTLDGKAVISAVDSIPGLYVGAGYTWGFLKGPGVGELLADLVTNKTPSISLDDFSLSRFA